MEQERLNIAEILKDYPGGTHLYSPPFGKVTLDYVDLTDKFPIIIKYNDGVNCVSFMKDGRYVNIENVECCLLPSKEMRDWEKMKWKRGDVVTDIDNGITAIFDGWASDTYDKFNTAYSYEAADSSYNEDVVYETCDFVKSSDGDRLRFIAYLEKEYHGKFNADTLEIEKSFEPKNGDFICFVDEDSERHIVIFKSMDSRWLKYHASVMRNGTWFNCNSAFGTTFNERENIFNLRLATEKEKQVLLSVLASRGKTWDSEKCCVEELPNTKKTECPFKPFDKVLVRVNEYDTWEAALFSRYNEKHIPVVIGIVDYNYQECIPYEGNEHLLGTTDNPTKQK